MPTITFSPTKIQHQAWSYLQDKTTINICYGGSCGSGKSFLGCMWLLISCLTFPSTRYLMGRAHLNSLKRTTLNTFIDICKQYKFKAYHINHTSNTIYFENGSEIILFDMCSYPIDPEYDRLGSLEITGAFLDEMSEISWKGFNVLGSRLRYKLNEFNLTPKIFCATNPTQGWCKNYFYTPYQEGREMEHVKFVPALPNDNPHLPTTYLESMNKTLDFALKQRLLFGSWSFSGDEYNLFDYDMLQQCFYNEVFVNSNKEFYITSDIADLGSDSTVITVWQGHRCFKILKLQKKNTLEIVDEINKLRTAYNVKIQHIITDSSGVGAAVATILRGSVRYMAGSKSINTGFKNLKTELFYKFSQKVNALEIFFNFPYNDEVIQELLLYKKEFTNLTAGITSKDNIKKQLSRSPDYADALYLRAYFDIKPITTTKIRII